MNTINANVNKVSRYGLAATFIYHGLIPKILFLDPVEVALTNAHWGLDASWASPMAGVGEILLGGLIVLVRKALWPVYLAAFALLVLLLDVAVVKPELLSGAFNPVTTNGLALCLCYFIYISEQSEVEQSKT